MNPVVEVNSWNNDGDRPRDAAFMKVRPSQAQRADAQSDPRIPVEVWWALGFVVVGVALWWVLSLIFGPGATRAKIVLFVTSEGFAGLAAVIVAVIAAFNISRQIRQTRRAELHQNWWTNFKWATERAVPSDDKAIALPYSTSIATIATLQGATDDLLQKAACATFVDFLAQRAGAQSGAGTSDPGRFQALRNYNAAAEGTKAESVGAQRVIYQRGFLNALEYIAVVQKFGYVQDFVLTDGKSKNPLRVEGGSSTVDAKLVRDGVEILVKLRWWEAEPEEAVLQRRIEVTVGRIKQDAPKAAIILIVRFDVPVTVAAAQRPDVRVLKWDEGAESKASLQAAIDELSVASRSHNHG